MGAASMSKTSMSEPGVAPGGAGVSAPGRLHRRMARARPGWAAALRVTLAGHLDISGGLSRSIGGTRHPLVIGALVLLVLFGIGSAEFALFMMMRTMHITRVIVGQPATLPAMAVMGSQLLVLVFGVGFAISSLFFSADVPRFMAMPLQPASIMGVRLATLYVDVLLVTALIMAPVFAAAASILPETPSWLTISPQQLEALIEGPPGLTTDPVYWLAAVWLLLWIPVLPLGLATLVAVAVGRGTSLGRRRDWLYVAGSLVGVAFALGYNYLNMRIMTRLSDPQELMSMLETPNALVLEAVRYYPPARWAVEALMGALTGTVGGAAAGVGPRVMGLVLFAASALAVVVPAFALAQRWYFAGVQAGLEEPQARRQRRAGGAGGTQQAVAALLARPARSRLMALAAREWRVLFRTPPFMLPVVTNVLIPPIVVGMLVLFMPAEETGGSSVAMMLQGVDPRWLMAGLAGLIVFMGGTTQVSTTSISREGKGLAQVAALPATPAEQVGARLLVAAPFALATALFAGVIATAMVGLPAQVTAVGVAVGLAGLWPAVTGGLWLDMLRPVTNWDNPQQAMKGNMNGLWNMVVSLATLAAAGGAGYLVLRAGSDLGRALGVATAVMLALGGVLTWLCLRQAERLFGDAGEEA